MASSLAHGDFAIDVLKAGIFVKYLQKAAPNVAEVTGLSANLTQALKDQADKLGGESPFMAVFEQAKAVTPGIAAEGYAYAATFAAYVAKEAPGVLNQIKDTGGDGLAIIQSQAPTIFAGAENAGNVAVKFVSDNGLDVLRDIESAGGNIFSFLHENHGAIFSVVTQGISIGTEGLQQVGGIIAAGTHLAAGLDVGGALDAAKTVGILAGGVIGVVGGAVVSAVSNIDAGTTAEIASAAMNVVGVAAAAMPFLLPLQIALKDIGNAVQMATYNKEDAHILKDRCEDSTKLVAEMAPKILKIASSEAERDAMIKPFADSLIECRDFLKLFCGRNFLMHMFYWKKEGRSLVSLDKKVSNTLQNLAVRVNGHQIDLQLKQSEKMNEMFDLLNKVSDNSKEPNQLNPEELTEILQKAGVKTKEEIMSELQSVGFKLEDIEASINKMSSKLDALNNKLDDVKDSILLHQREQMDELKLMLLQSQEATLKRTEQIMTLAAMRDKASSSGGKGGAAVITEVYSTPNQVEALSKRANALKSACPQVALLHPHGVGYANYEKKDGDPGPAGRTGRSFAKATNGRAGAFAGADGEDGLDGDDGDDGDEGHDGESGETCQNFEIMIEFVSENKDRNTRTYHIEHAGPAGKDEHNIEVSLLNSVIFLDGKGGRGGKGGDGGAGGSGGRGGDGGTGAAGSGNQDGGNGGSGGTGGGGGNGGLAGAGGNGANGGKIIIHTNDPSVLALLEIDCSAGEGGVAGKHGQAGLGGEGGNAGEPGAGGTYTEQGNNGQYITKQGRPGRKGKGGKKGKNGKNPPSKQSKDGGHGSCGKISYCIYNEQGFLESGGTPFRVVIHKKDYTKLYPQPHIFDTLVPSSSSTSPLIFVYGQKIVFGPLLPVNIGSLMSPPVKYLGTASISAFAKNISSTSFVKFPTIPGENKTRYGELPPQAKQTLEVLLPKLKTTGYQLNSDAWPWAMAWSPTPKTKFHFHTIFNVDGILQKSTPFDSDHNAQANYELEVDIPMEIQPLPANLFVQATSAPPVPWSMFLPSSIECSASSEIFVTFIVRNKLPHAVDIPSGLGNVGLSIAGYQFLPRVQSMVLTPNGTQTITATLPLTDQTNGYHRMSVITPIQTIPKLSSAEFCYKLTLPTASQGQNGADAGSNLVIRSELYYDEVLCQIAPVQICRLVAPWQPPPPNIAAGMCSDNTILIFCDSQYHVNDYKAFRQLLEKHLHVSVYFLDYEHYFNLFNGRIQSGKNPLSSGGNGVLSGPNMSAGKVPLALWEAFHGKCTLLFLPNQEYFASLINHDDLVSHVQKGGALIYGSQGKFSAQNSLNLPADSLNLANKHARKFISLGTNMNILEFKKELVLSASKLAGKVCLSIVVAIISAWSIERKITHLVQFHDELTALTVGQDTQLENYVQEIPTGCCSCGSNNNLKIFPTNHKTASTLHDLVLASIRTDLTLDMQTFIQQMNYAHCHNLIALQTFISTQVLNKSKDAKLGKVAQDLAAAMYAAGLQQENLGGSVNGKVKKVWKQYAKNIQLQILQCNGLAEQYQLDGRILAQRVMDVDVMKGFQGRNLFTVSTTSTGRLPASVDFSHGVSLFAVKTTA